MNASSSLGCAHGPSYTKPLRLSVQLGGMIRQEVEQVCRSRTPQRCRSARAACAPSEVVMHAWLHSPQLFLSIVVLTQMPLQQSEPAPHTLRSGRSC